MTFAMNQQFWAFCSCYDLQLSTTWKTTAYTAAGTCPGSQSLWAEQVRHILSIIYQHVKFGKIKLLVAFTVSWRLGWIWVCKWQQQERDPEIWNAERPSNVTWGVRKLAKRSVTSDLKTFHVLGWEHTSIFGRIAFPRERQAAVSLTPGGGKKVILRTCGTTVPGLWVEASSPPGPEFWPHQVTCWGCYYASEKI